MFLYALYPHCPCLFAPPVTIDHHLPSWCWGQRYLQTVLGKTVTKNLTLIFGPTTVRKLEAPMKCDHFINCHFVVFTCTPVCKLAQTIWIWKSDIGISQSSVKRFGKSTVCTNRCFPAVLWAIMLYSSSEEPISSNTLTFTAQSLCCRSEFFSPLCGQNCKY